MTMVRTRFAPSPTGYLHIGSARTALYCWLFARKTQGKFILRIEDTDLERSTPESVRAILDGMTWLHLDYDEGPFYQTKRFERYHEVAEQLLQMGHAYRCYCSKERLETLRAEQMANKEKPRYDGHCRGGVTKEGPFVIRFKNPIEGVVEFDDLIRGKVTFSNAELDDLIIVRTDGAPTYNFSVVVDDWDMKITHVLRGDDHINNTPRQINILRALGAALPHYAHLPMILGSDGKRLSKRHGAVSVLQYREEGILPEAIINYLVRLGWSHGDQEIFSLAELIDYFDIKDINKAPAALNYEKLLWLNQHYMKTLEPERLAAEFNWQMKKLDIDTQHGPDVVDIIKVQCERTKTLQEMAERSRYFYTDVSLSADQKAVFLPDLLPALIMVKEQLENLTRWEKETIHQVLVHTAEAQGLKLGKLAQPLRIAITGGTVSPPIDITMELIGRERVLERINRVISY